MEGVKRTNVVVVRGQEQGMGAPRRDPYVIEVDWERNCYACGGFWAYGLTLQEQRKRET